MTNRLEGKRALVTGAGSGIGEAIARKFLEEGATVIALDRNPQAEAKLASAGADFLAVDVADTNALEAAAGHAVSTMGGIDVVVANAGYELVGDALELTYEQWDAHQAVMLRGVFATARATLPAMIDGGGGAIVATASQLSFAALPRFTSYLAAKAGVVGLVRGLAVDFADRGVRVNALCPGPTMTPMIERQLVGVDDPEALLELWASDTILKRLGRPEEIAAGAVFLASDEASFMTGATLVIDGGYTAI